MIHPANKCIAYPDAITYAASKAALENITSALAFELGNYIYHFEIGLIKNETRTTLT